VNFVHDLSLTYKTPLRICALVIATAVLVTTSLVMRERDELRRDLISHSESVARLLANTLVEPIVHDDAWRAYEIINAPFHAAPGSLAVPGPAPELVMLLDARHRIYVSTQPTRYPMLGEPGHIDSDYAQVEQAIAAARPGEPTSVVTPGSGRLYMVLPVLYDGVEMGTLVLAYSGKVRARCSRRASLRWRSAPPR
jgi:two-component system, NtrC family, sensor kinase